MLWPLWEVAKAQFIMFCPKSYAVTALSLSCRPFLQQNETDGANKQLNNRWLPRTFGHDSGHKKAERKILSATISAQNPSE